MHLLYTTVHSSKHICQRDICWIRHKRVIWGTTESQNILILQYLCNDDPKLHNIFCGVITNIYHSCWWSKNKQLCNLFVVVEHRNRCSLRIAIEVQMQIKLSYVLLSKYRRIYNKIFTCVAVTLKQPWSVVRKPKVVAPAFPHTYSHNW